MASSHCPCPRLAWQKPDEAYSERRWGSRFRAIPSQYEHFREMPDDLEPPIIPECADIAQMPLKRRFGGILAPSKYDAAAPVVLTAGVVGAIVLIPLGTIAAALGFVGGQILAAGSLALLYCSDRA